MRAYLWRFAQAVGLIGGILVAVFVALVVPIGSGFLLMVRLGPALGVPLGLITMVLVAIIEGAALIALDKDFRL